VRTLIPLHSHLRELVQIGVEFILELNICGRELVRLGRPVFDHTLQIDTDDGVVRFIVLLQPSSPQHTTSMRQKMNALRPEKRSTYLDELDRGIVSLDDMDRSHTIRFVQVDISRVLATTVIMPTNKKMMKLDNATLDMQNARCDVHGNDTLGDARRMDPTASGWIERQLDQMHHVCHSATTDT